MQLIIFGPPGVGKGTQAKILAAKLNLLHISTGDILRQEVAAGTPLGMKAKAILDSGKLVSDDVMIGIIGNALRSPKANNGFILDGFPRTVTQAEALTALLAKINIRLDAVINMEIESEAVVKRLSNRLTCQSCGKIFNLLTDKLKNPSLCPSCGGTLFQRDDDKPETILNRLSVYESSTAPVKSYYAKTGMIRTVNSTGTIEEINEKIVEIIKKK